MGERAAEAHPRGGCVQTAPSEELPTATVFLQISARFLPSPGTLLVSQGLLEASPLVPCSGQCKLLDARHPGLTAEIFW